MLRFDNLSKRYGERIVFQGLQHAFGAGCVALCDENGSGKYTLFGLLAGTLQADTGEVWLGGHSLRSAPLEAKAALAYVPDDCLTYPTHTGRAFLELMAANQHATVSASTLELAERFGLAPHLEKRFEQMSLGSRKKFFLTAATLGESSVVIADEPDAGLDAAARAVLIDLFKTLGRDRTVLFSSYHTVLMRGCDAKTTSFADLGMPG